MRLHERRVQIVGRAEVKLLGSLVVLVDRAPVGAGELTGARDDRVEHRLDVQRRADGAADLAQRRELLHRARQLGRPLPQLVEQADVLDGDHRLVGERLEKRDLLGREGMDLGPPSDEDDAQRRALAQQRRHQHCPGDGPGLPHAGHGFRELRLGRHDVLDVDRPPVAHTRPATVSRLTGTVSPTVSALRSVPCRATRRRCSPSRRKIDESVAPHTRAAFSATASMTGWRSVGELAITRRISAVAVCCSSDSFSSGSAPRAPEQPHVLDRRSPPGWRTSRGARSASPRRDGPRARGRRR